MTRHGVCTFSFSSAAVILYCCLRVTHDFLVCFAQQTHVLAIVGAPKARFKLLIFHMLARLRMPSMKILGKYNKRICGGLHRTFSYLNDCPTRLAGLAKGDVDISLFFLRVRGCFFICFKFFRFSFYVIRIE